MKIEHLPDAELDVMKALWESSSPLKASEIAKRLSEKHSWKVPTVHALLSRLEEKGFVFADRASYFHRFSATVTEEEYLASESAKLLRRSGTKLPALVAALMNSDEITDEEIEELSLLIDEKRKGYKSTKETLK